MATYPVGGEWVYDDKRVHGLLVSFRFKDSAGHRLDLDFKRTPKRCKLTHCTIYSPSWHTLLECDKDDKRVKKFGIDKVIERYSPLVFLMTEG
mgnify:CR=1 FL=1